jgi:hypothetical protein
MNIVLDSFTTGHDLWISDNPKSFGMTSGERMQAMLQVRIRTGDMFIEPKLDTRNPALRRFKQVRQNMGVVSEYVQCEPKSVPKRNCEIDVRGRVAVRLESGLGDWHEWSYG